MRIRLGPIGRTLDRGAGSAIVRSSDTVRCVQGANEYNLPLGGKPVGWVRANLRSALNISPDAVALLGGIRVGDGAVLTPGDTLEFLRPKGRKGLGEVFTPEELIERMKLTLEDFKDLVAAGLPVHRLRDGSLRITETQLDRFLDQRAGLVPVLKPDAPHPSGGTSESTGPDEALPDSDTIRTNGEPSRDRSPYLDAEGAAAYLGITLASLYGLVERRRLVPLRGPRRRYRFTATMLDDYLRRTEQR